MSKKPSGKRRQRLNARQQQPAKVKSRPRVQTDANVTEDGVIGAGEPTQAGDTQGLSGIPDATFESVKELTEEGQYLEAEVVDGVENAPPADAGPVKTKEVPENDVPAEYRVPNRERQS
jgi:hypothetical protein